MSGGPVHYTGPATGVAEVVAALDGAGFAVAGRRHVRRTLLDTFDGRLHRRGMRLEWRERGRAAASLVLRERATPPAAVEAGATPRTARDLPPGPLRARLAPVLDVRALLPVLVVEADEVVATRRNRAGKAVVTVTVHDRLRAGGAGEGGGPSWVVEVGELTGYPAAAGRAAALLGGLGLRPGRGDVVDAVAAAHGVDLRGVAASPTVPLDHRRPALPAFAAVLANLAATVDANLPGTLDDVDPEFLHDLRVAVRRTRSVLGLGRRVLPPAVRDRHREGFRWLGTETGPARDLDVWVLEWDGYVAPLDPASAAALGPVLDLVSAQRRAAHAALNDTLRSARYRQLMDGWRDWLDAARDGDGGAEGAGPDAGLAVGVVAADRLAGAQRAVLARGRAISDATAAEELHELRKDAKKLRYVVECFGSLLAPEPRKAFVQQLKALQDNLGRFQDAAVHAARLRELAADLPAGAASPATLVAAGELAAGLEQHQRDARAEFAARFARYDSKATARAVRELRAAARSGRR